MLANHMTNLLILVYSVIVNSQKSFQLLPPARNDLLTSIPSLADLKIPESERQFRVVYEWRLIDFAYANDYDRQIAIKRGEYIERNVIISDLKAFASRLYLALPRMLPGVPATLGWIISPDNNGRSDPVIEPFPSWGANTPGDCRALQFVQGIEIDADGFLWAVDSGKLNTLAPGQSVGACPPKLIIFDLKRNGTITKIYEFPNEVVDHNTNYLNKIVVDGSFAYITDNSGIDPGIVVFSKDMNTSWKFRESNSMKAAANAVDFTVNGTNLRFSIHIDGIALGPYYNAIMGLDRKVYYSPLSSYHLYSIPASILRDPHFLRQSTSSKSFEIITDYGMKLSQTDGMIMDNRGTLYYGLLGEHAVAKWNSFQPFSIENQHIIAKDNNFIQWVDGMAFDENGYLYIVVNRLFNFVSGQLNPNEVNFRILRAKTSGLSYVFGNAYGVIPDDETFNNGMAQNFLLSPTQNKLLYFNNTSSNTPALLFTCFIMLVQFSK